ncbi:MAG: hypothetical protein ABR511_13040 [Acidimicrobiales bacterium]
MSPRVVRVVVFTVCAAGIVGMIVGSVADDNAVALTFGLVTAAAVACLIVATAVAVPAIDDAALDTAGRRIEEMVAVLVAAGASEPDVRALVREAVALGRTRGPQPATPPEKEVGAGVHGGRTPRPDGRTFAGPEQARQVKDR